MKQAALAVSCATIGHGQVQFSETSRSQFKWADEPEAGKRPAVLIRVRGADPFSMFGGPPSDPFEDMFGGAAPSTAVAERAMNPFASLFGMGGVPVPEPDPIAALLGGQDPLAGLLGGGQPKVVKRIIISDPFAHVTNEWGHMDEVHNNVH